MVRYSFPVGLFHPYHMPVYPGALPGTNWARTNWARSRSNGTPPPLKPQQIPKGQGPSRPIGAPTDAAVLPVEHV